MLLIESHTEICGSQVGSRCEKGLLIVRAMLKIAPLIREVVSTGRALVPTQPNFNDLSIRLSYVERIRN
jgi:hypothetical protein